MNRADKLQGQRVTYRELANMINAVEQLEVDSSLAVEEYFNNDHLSGDEEWDQVISGDMYKGYRGIIETPEKPSLATCLIQYAKSINSFCKSNDIEEQYCDFGWTLAHQSPSEIFNVSDSASWTDSADKVLLNSIDFMIEKEKARILNDELFWEIKYLTLDNITDFADSLLGRKSRSFDEELFELEDETMIALFKALIEKWDSLIEGIE